VATEPARHTVGSTQRRDAATGRTHAAEHTEEYESVPVEQEPPRPAEHAAALCPAVSDVDAVAHLSAAK